MGDRALVLGGAAGLWADVEGALELGEFDIVLATNDAGAAWAGRLDHWVTLHPEKLPAWEQQRAERGYPNGYVRWSHKADARSDRHTSDVRGSSGLFAVKVAREIGCDRIVLCGVPMEAEGAHFFDEGRWKPAAEYRNRWAARDEPLKLRKCVRSMSGWTRRTYGAPDAGWLKSS